MATSANTVAPIRIPANYINLYGSRKRIPKAVLKSLEEKTPNPTYSTALDELAKIEAFHCLGRDPHEANNENPTAFTIFPIFLTPEQIDDIMFALPYGLREDLTHASQVSPSRSRYATFTSVQKITAFIDYINEVFGFPKEEQFRLPTHDELEYHRHRRDIAEEAVSYYGLSPATGPVTLAELSQTKKGFWAHRVSLHHDGTVTLETSKIEQDESGVFLFSLVRSVEQAA